MTAIVMMKVHTVPVIIGDVLLSTDVDTKESIVLPGTGELSNNIKNTTFYPVGMVQKANVINDNLAFAWAGNYVLAQCFQDFIEEKLEFCDKVTYEVINEILQDFATEASDSSNLKDFSYVLMYRDKEKFFTSAKNCAVYDIEGYGEVFIGGTGIDAVKHHLSNIDFDDSYKKMPEGTAAIHKVLNILSRLWTHDVIDYKSIVNGFGAGYEVIALKNERFQKIGDILLTQAVAIDGGPAYPGPVFLKIDYIDEMLVLRVQHYKIKNTTEHKTVNNIDLIDDIHLDNRGYLVQPLSSKKAVNLEKLNFEALGDFNASHTAINILATKGDNSLTSVLTYFQHSKDCPIEFKDDGFFIPPKLINRIKEQVDWFYNEYCE